MKYKLAISKFSHSQENHSIQEGKNAIFFAFRFPERKIGSHPVFHPAFRVVPSVKRDSNTSPATTASVTESYTCNGGRILDSPQDALSK